jgi:hypothetical protein
LHWTAETAQIIPGISAVRRVLDIRDKIVGKNYLSSQNLSSFPATATDGMKAFLCLKISHLPPSYEFASAWGMIQFIFHTGFHQTRLNAFCLAASSIM